MEEIRKVEPVEKVANHKENSESYIKEEEIENEPNDFGKMLKEEQQRLRDEEREVTKKQLEQQRNYFNHLKEEYEKNRIRL